MTISNSEKITIKMHGPIENLISFQVIDPPGKGGCHRFHHVQYSNSSNKLVNVVTLTHQICLESKSKIFSTPIEEHVPRIYINSNASDCISITRPSNIDFLVYKWTSTKGYFDNSHPVLIHDTRKSSGDLDLTAKMTPTKEGQGLEENKKDIP